MQFNTEVYQSGEETLVVATGVLRLTNGETAKNALLEQVGRDGVKKLFIHTGGLTEVDSAGLGVLVGVHMSSRKEGVEIVLISPTSYQMKLFETTRLNSILKIESGVTAEEIRVRLKKPELQVAAQEE